MGHGLGAEDNGSRFNCTIGFSDESSMGVSSEAEKAELV